MKKYLYILIFLFTAHFAFATSVTVNTHSALVTAINGTADTIFIDGTIVTSAEILIKRNLVLIGINNGTLDGNNDHRILRIIQNTNVLIDNIKFINGYSAGDFGGAIQQGNYNLTIKNSFFENNGSINMYNGGAINIGENQYGSNIITVIKNTEFKQNKGMWGGAIGTLNTHQNNYLLVDGCKFIQNESSGGGAIMVEGWNRHEGSLNSQFNIINSSFIENSADIGTIFIDNQVYFLVMNCEFIKNTAHNGGALSLSGNSSPYHANSDKPQNIVNCTFVKNYTTINNPNDNVGGAIYYSSPSVYIYNCAFGGNTDKYGNNDIYADPNTPSTPKLYLYNSVYQHITGTLYANVNNFGNIAPTSIFTNFTNNDFSLRQNSVAVNGGNDSYYVNQWNAAFPTNTITTPAAHSDIQGNNRLQACRIDMGAYESPFFPTRNITAYFCENTTYNFNGTILTNEGIYYDTIPNEDCDTIIKLNLIKLYNQHYNYRDTSYKCEWYYFGGDSINETGIYSDTLVGQARNGCDSIITVDLLVRPREFDDTLNICADRLPITIYDTIINRNIINGTHIIRHRCARITLWVDIIPMAETHPPDIPKICANENSFILEFLPTNYQNTKPPTNYEIVFDNQAVPVGFNTIETQRGNFGNDNKMIVYLPEKIYPDYYNCKVTLTDDVYGCAPQVFDIEIPVLYPDSIMKQKWDNVIALTNYNYNGGFEYAGYQWFRNDTILPDENKSYIYRPLFFGDRYSVLLTRKDRSKLSSCEFAVLAPRQNSQFPTLVSPGSTIKIPQQDKNTTVRLITTTGIVLSTYKSDSEIIAPAQQGVYLLEILSGNNTKMLEKIVVK